MQEKLHEDEDCVCEEEEGNLAQKPVETLIAFPPMQVIKTIQEETSSEEEEDSEESDESE